MVYVVQEQYGKNILPAEKFGQLEILLPNAQVSFSSGPAVFILRKKLQKFCDDDYLLLIGDPILIGLASIVAAGFNNGKVRFLKWDRQEKKYFTVSVDTNRKEII